MMRTTTPKPSPISVLLATGCKGDRNSLEAILKGTPWALIETASRTEAMRFLRRTTASIVLCDRDLQDRPWQQTMLALLSVRRDTRFILLSSVEESTLRNEVVYRGGFDLLVRPFRREQVLSVLIGASSRHGAVTSRVPI